ncbi:SIR2 family protein [Shewanella khirikhana]|uniref:SIR2-like domain-containing protein n=1 Tax=Shewanella khirikhana TaxID=1965282 RepID=A0ABN5TZM7_9GAMM|nr:SIR2 family protein [Shewanella khirikhana]AZQ11832.1 hypothetical protein STH12_02763 [Shewanella khirikhana]
MLTLRLGSIDFPHCILDALRDDNLVIFAGAGVSMGAPSNLSDFWTLASDIAQGTGLKAYEPLDRFLGQLHHREVDVHERAAALLSPAGSSPNELHRNLLQLFRTVGRVRLVTTNFDLHFETAAKDLFDSVPDVYRAPALPLGYDFSGIVHVHGALPRSQDLVLTDADFGRAYLTEGWARRFLVDVFRKYTVLFIGYSHEDAVMNYLARALPANNFAGRFALTDDDGRWDLLGITPIRFKKGVGKESFKELYDGVRQLAERTRRGALDWQSRLADLGSRLPPTDEEAISEVEQALSEIHTTRFLLNFARGSEWLIWLNDRNKLAGLFSSNPLSDHDLLLAHWIADHYAIEHAQVVFDILAFHELKLNPDVWWLIGRVVGLNNQPIDVLVLKRWVSLLLTNASVNSNHDIFWWLANCCADYDCTELVLMLFMKMCEHRLDIKKGFSWPNEQGDILPRLDAEWQSLTEHWPLNEVWTKHLKPNLHVIVTPLLKSITQRFEEMHAYIVIWGSASKDYDSISYGRSAIEGHEQDQFPEVIDVLIDAVRDALEWLAENSSTLCNIWIEKLVISDVPINRRLAIHAMSVAPDRTPDECLCWLQEKINLHGLSEHHEMFRLASLKYPKATEFARGNFIESILTGNCSISDEELSPRAHYNWFSWLSEASPDCQLVKTALAQVQAQYTEWLPSDHPDFTHYMSSSSFIVSESPWSVDQLLNMSPDEQLEELISFTGDSFYGEGRNGLLSDCREACKQDPKWAFKLAQALTNRKLWASDLWSALIRGMKESELTVGDWRDLLTLVAKPELHSGHARDISRLLATLVVNQGKPFSLELLDQANLIAESLWFSLEVDPEWEEIHDWCSYSANFPAGVIVDFWIHGLSLYLRDKSGSDRVLPDSYRHWFTYVVQDPTSNGGIGRCVLASQISFLFRLDEDWTRNYVIPLFSDSNSASFSSAWDGFLLFGQLNPELVDALLPTFLEAIQRLNSDLSYNRDKFIMCCTQVLTFYVDDPFEKLLPTLFHNCSLQDRLIFAVQLKRILMRANKQTKLELWERWIQRYWQQRLQGVPVKLDENEVQSMLECLPHLDEKYSEAVTMAISFPKISIVRTDLLFELTRSELVTQFPYETTKLLIYLANCKLKFFQSDLAKVAARIQVPTELQHQLDEEFAHVGIQRNVD